MNQTPSPEVADPATEVFGPARGGAGPDRTNGKGRTSPAGDVFKGERAVIGALLAAGADPAAGTPSALDAARMFGKADLLERFGAR